MKLINEHPFIEGAPVVSEELNGAIKDIANALTNVDARILPADCVGLAELGQFQIIDFQNISTDQHLVQSGLNIFSTLTENSGTYHIPVFSILPGDIYEPGWNPLYIISPTDGAKAKVTIPATPGRIIGGVTIDSELRCSVIGPFPTPALPYSNRDLWWEFAVFANGSEAARSPRLYAGRHTVSIPFIIFSGAEEVTFDIRVRVYFGEQSSPSATSRNIEPLAIHNFQTWSSSTSK